MALGAKLLWNLVSGKLTWSKNALWKKYYSGIRRKCLHAVEIQQEDPSENYAPTLGRSLMLFLGGNLFLDDEQILFIDGERIIFIDVCQLLLSLNNSLTINISLFSMSTWK
jgi:hypothetical protein